jgi:hypothetical protein
MLMTFLSLTILWSPLLASDDEVSDRIDFSSARIMGQANDFGAVYLMHRKQNEMTSMLSIRSNYRLEILFSLEYLPIDESTGLVILPMPFGEDEYEAGFEPVETRN